MRKAKSVFSQDRLDTSSNILRALAHPLRLKLLAFIDGHGTVNVNKIYSTLNLEQSITSQHLRILRMADLVISERDGKFIYYSVHYDKVGKAMEAVHTCFAPNAKGVAVGV